MVDFEQLKPLLTAIFAAGGGGAAVAYGLFRLFGSKWLEGKFAERLQNHKHEQEKEIQRLRLSIDSLLSGSLKLQEMEFKVLPEAWSLLDDVRNIIISYTHPFQEYPDLSRMTNSKLEEFFQDHWLSETDKEDIRISTDRNKTYQEAVFWYRARKVRESIGELQKHIAHNGIFFPKEIRTEFDSIIKIFITAFVEHKMEHQYPQARTTSDAFTKIESDAEPFYRSIEQKIAMRLRSHGATELSAAQTDDY